MILEVPDITKAIAKHFQVTEGLVKLSEVDVKNRRAQVEIGVKNYILHWSRKKDHTIFSLLQEATS